MVKQGKDHKYGWITKWSTCCSTDVTATYVDGQQRRQTDYVSTYAVDFGHNFLVKFKVRTLFHCKDVPGIV